jgi:nucleotide-binding universal stress UspA family protein
MRKIIVGVDLSAQSELAVAAAVDRARRDDAEVVLALVETLPLSDSESATMVVVTETARRLAQQQLHRDRLALAELRERWIGHGARVSQLVVDGYADEALPRVASDLGADLVVVGSHGRTGMARVMIGSTAELVARRAECSVLIARGAAPSGGYRRIVVGTDFSSLAHRAEIQAIAMAGANARIDLVHCVQPPVWGFDGVRLPMGDVVEDLTDQGKALAAMLAERTDATVAFHVEVRPAAFGLVDLATELTADLIVVGSHGRRGVRRFLLGSVAERTARHAPCSTLIAR